MRPVLLALTFVPLALFAQQGATRGIQPESVVLARPKAKTAATAARPQYQAANQKSMVRFREPGSAILSADARQVGITVWRLRKAEPGDSGARILVQEEAATTEWIPERLGSNANLKAGDRVRLSIESPDTGYLYVIDRERYSDGSRGEPYLIFPTTRTNGGDNHLRAGKLAEIPAQTDRPNFFTLRRGKANQTDEELTVLLTPMPITGIEPGRAALKVTEEQVAAWEKQWGSKTLERFELTNGAGKAWTRAEQEAGANTTRLLTQEEPPPQTVYRAAGAGAADPLMVKVNLRYR
jgi:hypothetical protein